MDEDGSLQSGQQDVGCVEITEIIKPVAVIWIWSMSIPSGSGSSGVFSITTSFLATKQSAFRLLMEETIPRQVNLSFHASECGFNLSVAVAQPECCAISTSEKMHVLPCKKGCARLQE